MWQKGTDDDNDDDTPYTMHTKANTKWERKTIWREKSNEMNRNETKLARTK